MKKTILTKAISIQLCAALAFTALVFTACASKTDNTNFAKNETMGTHELLDSSRKSALQSTKETNRGESKRLAKSGIESAERCLMYAPENAGCHYWRAVNTGIYYSIRIIGYQKGIKQMIDDCESVIAIDPTYDESGAYRMLGRIYTQLPQTGVRPDSITRDILKAEDYLKEAVKLSPDYPENHIALSDNLFAQQKIIEALSALSQAKQLAPRWKHDVSYAEWNKEINGLEKKLAKANN